MENNLVIISCPLADPGLQIRGGGRVGDGHLDPEIGGPGLKKKKFFSALRASVWFKNKGGGGGGRAGGPPGPLPWIRH